jgi:Histidine kinase-, DNA gyrase B-, and HSP90-like ATPase
VSSQADQIFVRSHVARDLLQNAALFKTDKLVIWEYVSNGLQYTDPGTNPVVRVFLDSKRKCIRISDNGRGMDWASLQNFFVMHGENIDRKQGRPGRGRFGTGKSAAFGIADKLQITTVRGGRRSVVALTRADIDAMSSEDPIPVKVIEKEVPTSKENGTLVEIEGVHLRSLDQSGTIRYIERHLARWPKNCSVFVNNHECEYFEPPIASQKRFLPEGSLKKELGDAEMVVKVSKAPLEEDLRGVSIYSNGVWHETTLGSSEGREMSQYIFGEIDVPRLDEDKSPIPPFDLSRSMKLNPNNQLVQAIYAFISQKVELTRTELLERERQRRATEEAQKLEQEASEIARVINEDFEAFRLRVAKAKARAVGTTDPSEAEVPAGEEGENLIFGDDIPSEIVAQTGGRGSEGGGGGGGGTPRDLMPLVSPKEGEEKRGRSAGELSSGRRPRGGFKVQFKRMGTESYRAQYVPDERTIYINLDHPQLVAALGIGSIEDPAFRRLAYEVAFSEYAVSLASELANRDEYLDPSDPIVDIRDTLNRLARKGASLYA